MHGSNASKDITNLNQVGHLTTAATYAASRVARLTEGGANFGIRISVYLGKITGSDCTIALKQSMGLGFYSAMAESATLSASTNKSLTLDYETSATVITSTGHGYTDGQLVAITAVTMPTGLVNTRPYRVIRIDANSFQLAELGELAGAAPVSFSSNGNTVLASPVSEVKLRATPFNATDEVDFPLGDSLKVELTVASGRQVQLLGVRATGAF